MTTQASITKVNCYIFIPGHITSPQKLQRNNRGTQPQTIQTQTYTPHKEPSYKGPVRSASGLFYSPLLRHFENMERRTNFYPDLLQKWKLYPELSPRKTPRSERDDTKEESQWKGRAALSPIQARQPQKNSPHPPGPMTPSKTFPAQRSTAKDTQNKPPPLQYGHPVDP